MMLMNVGLSESTRKDLARRLNLLLANEFLLYTKTLKFHWNVKGPFFGPLHDLFHKQYIQLQDIADEVAERSLQLGFNAAGTLKEFLATGTVTEEPGAVPDDKGMLTLLVHDHETIIRQIRYDIEHSEQVNDAGTANFLSELIERHEKMAWVLRAHIQ